MSNRTPGVIRGLAIALACGAGTVLLGDVPRKNLVRAELRAAQDGSNSPAWRLVPGGNLATQATIAVDAGPGKTSALRIDYPAVEPRPGSVDALAAPPVGIEQDGIALNVSDPYTLSFWLRGKDISGRAVRVSLGDDSGHPYTAVGDALFVTDEWKHYTINFQWWLNQAPATTKLRFSLSEYGTLWIAGTEIVCESHPAPRINPRVSPGPGKNLVPNGSFEAGKSGWTTLSLRTGWGGLLTGLYGEVTTENAQDGKNCLRIQVGPDKSPVTYADGWPPARVVQTSLLAANRGWIDLVQGKTYTLSAYLRADRPGVTARLMIRQAGGTPMTQLTPAETKVQLTEKWERYTFSIKAQADQACIAVGPDITDKPDTPATVWLDGIQFEAADQATALERNADVAVGFEVAPRDYILDPGQPLAVQVAVANSSANPADVKLQATVRNYFGQIVGRPELTVTAAAGSNTRQTWTLGAWGKGIFTVTIDWTQGGASQRTALRLASLEAYASRDSIFGINHAPPSAELCAMVQKAGIRWSRDWSLNWGQLEPEPGRLSFDGSDVQLNRLRDAGFNIVCLTPPLPSTDWSSTAPDSVPANLWNRMGYLPKDPRQLLEFVRKAVEHTRDRVHVWEFLNEPIWTGFCLPQEDFNKPESRYVPADYVQLLKQAYPVIKRADPEGRVIGGFAAQPWHFAREFVELGGLDAVDIFNIHNYGTSLPPEFFIPDMEALDRLMTQKGGRKPIWLTEYSYYGSDILPWEPWSPPSDSWAANLLLRDERQCADWTVRYNLIMLAHGVEKIFYHSGVTGEPNSLAHSLECAMLGDGGEPRKLFAAQATLANILGPDCRFSAPLGRAATVSRRPTDGLHGYAFQCGARAVMPVWATEATAKLHCWRIRLPAGVNAVDLMGNPIESRTVAFDTSPVYLVSTTLSAAQLATACTIELEPKSAD